MLTKVFHLVNGYGERTGATAKLTEYQTGNQIILYTCNDHVYVAMRDGNTVQYLFHADEAVCAYYETGTQQDIIVDELIPCNSLTRDFIIGEWKAN